MSTSNKTPKEIQPTVSVITPVSRGIHEQSILIRDFRNQTFQDFEHVLVIDGKPAEGVLELFNSYEKGKIFQIEKDMGNMSIAPGTKPRNHGIEVSKGQYLVFCDDDDRYKDTYLESLVWGIQDNLINCVQMGCGEHRVRRNGDRNKLVMIPEVGLPGFPMICHVGTPCFIVKREWALEDPWREEREHDYWFIRRIVEKHKVAVRQKSGMQVEVDGFLSGVKDWVSRPPFFRG